uniref:Uncharacterized protein n=1 Tax=Nelumbo nucifera TaxID=4432 RepID=A0A822ZAT0_NELNU|nr:TPA_asm: hypothetical protein HUJ06_000257 [Nelumbo nucifera]
MNLIRKQHKAPVLDKKNKELHRCFRPINAGEH